MNPVFLMLGILTFLLIPAGFLALLIPNQRQYKKSERVFTNMRRLDRVLRRHGGESEIGQRTIRSILKRMRVLAELNPEVDFEPLMASLINRLH